MGRRDRRQSERDRAAAPPRDPPPARRRERAAPCRPSADRTVPALPVTATVIAAPARSILDAVSAKSSPRRSPDAPDPRSAALPAVARQLLDLRPRQEPTLFRQTVGQPRDVPIPVVMVVTPGAGRRRCVYHRRSRADPTESRSTPAPPPPLEIVMAVGLGPGSPEPYADDTLGERARSMAAAAAPLFRWSR